MTDFYALSLTIFASQDSRIYCDGSGQDDFGGVLRVATAVGEVPRAVNPDAALGWIVVVSALQRSLARSGRPS